MTKILLTRHGHVEGIAPERFRGRQQLALTERGRAEVQALARRIAGGWKPQHIYTSPLQRCVDTGTAIARTCGIAAGKPRSDLNDIDYGDWQGLTRDEAHARWPAEIDLWYAHPDWAALPNGESLQQVLTRAVAALRDIVRRHPDDTVVLVAHDSVNRVLLLHALELPLSRYWRLKQSPCCINELDFGPDGFTIHSINRTGHLPPG